jgi:DNA-binding MarR family transcriptional regulator
MSSQNLFSKLKEKLKKSYRKRFIDGLYVDDKEPPKSFAFDKRFYGLYGVFLFYSFIFLLAINFPDNIFVFIVTFGNPFVFGCALMSLFLILSLLLNNDKIRIFVFEERTKFKQLFLYIGIMILFYLMYLYIYTTGLNLMSLLLGLSTIWLILLSTRFYMYSRKFATKIEARFISKYSPFRRFIALISPYFILTILVVIALFYRGLLVFLSLDFFGPFAPAEAVGVYEMEMKLVMPLIYVSLILTLLFILFEFVFTRKKAETKKAGLFDNYTFSLIVLFIFFFQIWQVSIFLILSDETIIALKATVGATSSSVTFIFIFEFLISMFFLSRIIKKLGRSLGWRLFIYKQDGFISLILGCVFAQTLSRFSLQTQVANQELTMVAQFFMADKYVVSILMIIFLGVTLLVYYIKPHETSMFIRLQKEIVSTEEEKIDIVYKLVRSEYIRRGEAYPIEILEKELIRTTKLSKQNVYSLLKKLVDKDPNILLIDRKNDLGTHQKYIDFVSVTEQFDKKDVAQQKTKKYLSEQLYQTMRKSSKRNLKLSNEIIKDKASDQFISSLTSGFKKKRIDEESYKKKQQGSLTNFTNKQVPDALKEQIIEVLKKEYLYRIENPDKYPDFQFPISAITDQIQLETRITPGELYPLLENVSLADLEFELITNPEEPEDKLVNFYAIADDNISYSLFNFRPIEYEKFKVRVIKSFNKSLRKERAKATLNKLDKSIEGKNENQKIWKKILNLLGSSFEEQEKIIRIERNGVDINPLIKKLPKKDITIFLS